MSDDLSIQGTLAETTVPDLFRSLIRNAETAIVRLEADGRGDAIYFSGGRLVFASSSDPDMGLAEILLRSGDLNLQQYTDAVERHVSSRRIGSVLVELGYLKSDELIRAVEQQVSHIVLNVVGQRSGSYTIEFKSAFPPDVVPLHLNTERLVIDGVNRVEYWSLVARGVGKLARNLVQAPNSDSRVYSLELAEEESYLYSLLAEPHTTAEICARSYLTNFVTCRKLWALLSVNLIEDAATGAMTQKRAAAETELELEAAVERYNSAYQKIWAIVFQKIGDHTYDFIDRVVVHLSPEILPYLSGVNLLNEGRIDFDQLLNNVISSGTGDRAAIVNNVLNELLYGWVLEVKSELGDETEASVIRSIAALRK
jgi:Domain of unknown function (DUF4388)